MRNRNIDTVGFDVVELDDGSWAHRPCAINRGEDIQHGVYLDELYPDDVCSLCDDGLPEVER